MSSRPIASEAPGGRPRRLSNVSKMANMFEQQAVQQPPLSNLPVGGGANYSGQPPPSNPKQPPARPPKPPSRPPKPVNVLTPSGSPHSAPGSLQVAHSNTGSDRMYTTASGQRPVSPSRSMHSPASSNSRPVNAPLRTPGRGVHNRFPNQPLQQPQALSTPVQHQHPKGPPLQRPPPPQNFGPQVPPTTGSTPSYRPTPQSHPASPSKVFNPFAPKPSPQMPPLAAGVSQPNSGPTPSGVGRGRIVAQTQVDHQSNTSLHKV